MGARFAVLFMGVLMATSELSCIFPHIPSSGLEQYAGFNCQSGQLQMNGLSICLAKCFPFFPLTKKPAWDVTLEIRLALRPASEVKSNWSGHG